MAHGTPAFVQIHIRGDRVAERDFTGGERAEMTEHVRLDLLRVLYLKQGEAGSTFGEFT